METTWYMVEWRQRYAITADISVNDAQYETRFAYFNSAGWAEDFARLLRRDMYARRIHVTPINAMERVRIDQVSGS